MRAKFVPDNAGYRAARKAPETMAELARLGGLVAAEAGDGYEVIENNDHPYLGRVWVQPATPEARAKNARDQRLLAAVGRLSV